MDGPKNNSFLAKAGLVTILVGFGLFALAMVFQQHEAGGAIFFLTLILSLVCGIYSRKHPISRVTLLIDLLLIVSAGAGALLSLILK